LRLCGKLNHNDAENKQLRLLTLALFALLPSFLKRPFYRWFFGYRVGKRVRIGVSIIDAGECEIDDDVRIGHLNVVTRVQKFVVKDHVRIGHLNIIRGGDLVSLGRYAEIIRLNEINSIPDPEVVNPIDPTFILGDGSIVTAGHKIDFTDRVEIGRRVILGGGIRRSGRIIASERCRSRSVRWFTSVPRFAWRRQRDWGALHRRHRRGNYRAAGRRG
jgi:hypothetical protein